MQAPKLPSIFKYKKNKRFRFSARYYDERKERIEQIKKGENAKIKIRHVQSSSFNKKRSLRLFSLLLILVIISLLILKK